MKLLEKIDKYLQEQEEKSVEYKAFFEKMLKKYGVKSPAELKGDKKKQFFDEVDKGFKAEKETD